MVGDRLSELGDQISHPYDIGTLFIGASPPPSQPFASGHRRPPEPAGQARSGPGSARWRYGVHSGCSPGDVEGPADVRGVALGFPMPSSELLVAIREFTTTILNPYDLEDLLDRLTDHAIIVTGSGSVLGCT